MILLNFFILTFYYLLTDFIKIMKGGYLDKNPNQNNVQ